MEPRRCRLRSSRRAQRRGGRAKLRLGAVDALETRYGPSRDHQPFQFAHAARAELLKPLGFVDVQLRPDKTVTAATPETFPGLVLTRRADVHGLAGVQDRHSVLSTGERRAPACSTSSR
ncbi:hypothetical protein [Streptomyces sp. NPDC001500]